MKDWQKENLRALKEAIWAVQAKINPPTLGPCHFCGWPITTIVQGPPENMVETCDLCDCFCDTLVGKRCFWAEYPANAI